MKKSKLYRCPAKLVPVLDAAKRSNKQFGPIKCYAVNTCKGIIRAYNEDRVSIVLNLQQPEGRKCSHWPSASFFAVSSSQQVFDGHGGSSCAEFLKERLAGYIVEDSAFPTDVPSAILNGCRRADNEFVAKACKAADISGSCACCVLTVEGKAYVFNVGDSRAIASHGHFARCIDATVDHKPNHQAEKKRIEAAGGKVYK